MYQILFDLLAAGKQNAVGADGLGVRTDGGGGVGGRSHFKHDIFILFLKVFFASSFLHCGTGAFPTERPIENGRLCAGRTQPGCAAAAGKTAKTLSR